MATGTFDFNEFIKESLQTIFNPKSYFTALPLTGGIAEPLVKGVIYGTITAVIYLLWDVLNIGGSGMMLFGVYGFTGFLKLIISSVIGLFILALAILVLSNICKGSTGFEASFRVAAATMVIMPVSAFFGFLMFNPFIYLIVSLLIYALGLWILYNGMVHALKGQEPTVKTVCYVIAVVIVVISLAGLAARSRMNRMLDEDRKEVSR